MIKEFIKGILTEDNGNYSSKRFIAVSYFTTVLITWFISCLRKGDFLDIPNGVYMTLGVVAGMLAVGKFGEKKSE